MSYNVVEERNANMSVIPDSNIVCNAWIQNKINDVSAMVIK